MKRNNAIRNAVFGAIRKCARFGVTKKCALLGAIFMSATVATAQISEESLNVFVPAFDARLSMGFNYDLLRSLTDVPFDGALGYIGMNVPFLGLGGNLQDFLGDDAMDEIFDSSGIFRRGGNFRPTARAEQSDNYTVRVDVPMLQGVGTFAYTQNFFFNFATSLGGAEVVNLRQNMSELADNENVSGYLAIKGALRLPLDIRMGWETMTFGYAYRVDNNPDLVFAFNLHRHLFSMNLRLRADIDLLGHANIQAVVPGNPELNIPDVSFGYDGELINFSSDVCNGMLTGRYRAVAWTPSFGARVWRFTLDSRLGFKARARGSAYGRFVIPAIVDLETGDVPIFDQIEDLAGELENNPAFIFDMIPKDTDSLVYEIGETMHWEMPHGHTIGFDIVRDRVKISYTKLFGEVNLRIEDIRRMRVETEDGEEGENGGGGSGLLDPEYENLRLDAGVNLDHILVLSLDYPSFFMNVGVAGFDIWSRSRSGRVNRALGDVEGLQAFRLGDVVMVMPILSGGVHLGTRLQLRLEADILPLPAVRSGVRYHF